MHVRDIVEPFQTANHSTSWLHYKEKSCQFLVELQKLRVMLGKEENLVLRKAGCALIQ